MSEDFDDEDLDEELDDEEEDEDLEDDEEDDDSDEDESSQEENNSSGKDGESNFFEILKQNREKRERAQLNDMQKKIFTLWEGKRFYYPHFKFKEKMFLWKMKRKGKYNTQITTMENTMKSMQEAYKTTYKSVASAIAPYMGYIALFIFIIIVVIVIIATIMPWLFPEEGVEGGKKKMNSAFGVKGDKFYGCRTVYKDEALAQNGLIEQYTLVVKDTVTALETLTFEKTDTKGTDEVDDDVVYEVSLDVLITLPEEDFKYSDLNVEEFKTSYPQLFDVVYDISLFVAKNDSGETISNTTKIEEVLNKVKYFGFNESLIGSSIDSTVDNVMEVILNNLITNNLMELKEKVKGTTNEPVNASFATMADVETEIENLVISTVNVEANKIRLEKLFVKDFIFEDEESYCEGIEENQYIAFIYMAKEEVEMEYMSYMVNCEEGVEVSLALTNKGSKINLDEGDGENWGVDESDTSITKMYSSKKKLNETISVYQNIDKNNLGLLTNGESLYSALKLFAKKGVNKDIYLSSQNDGEQDYYSVKISDNDTVLSFESNGKFAFNDEAKYE